MSSGFPRKLTAAQVLRLRALPRRLAHGYGAKFGISQAATSKIWNGVTYKHLPVPPPEQREYGRVAEYTKVFTVAKIRELRARKGNFKYGERTALAKELGVPRYVLYAVVKGAWFKWVKAC